jgi:hypothetical protein
MPLPFWTIGCIYGATSVTLGAFGAHGLKKRITDPARIANWNTAAPFQMGSPSFGYSVSQLLINNMALNQKVVAGEGEFGSHFLCVQVADDDLPWDIIDTWTDW